MHYQAFQNLCANNMIRCMKELSRQVRSAREHGMRSHTLILFQNR